MILDQNIMGTFHRSASFVDVAQAATTELESLEVRHVSCRDGPAQQVESTSDLVSMEKS